MRLTMIPAFALFACALIVSELPAQESSIVLVKRRASEIDPRAKEHPEIGFVFADAKGKPADVQHAYWDKKAKSQDKLMIWLMGNNAPLLERVAGYGYNVIQVHYANQWFSKVPKDKLNDGVTLGKIRLEAAIGEDHSPLVAIPRHDSMAERAFQFVNSLAKTHPEAGWEKFLNDQRDGLRWDKVTVSGISHGATTAARFAIHQKVDRVVMFSGPRDQFETWHSFASATPPERFFGFTHVLDGGWTGDHYCRSWIMLGLNKFGPVVDVDSTPAPYGDSRRLVTACDVKKDANRAHSAVIPGGAACKDARGQFVHEPVWRYLFNHPVAQVGQPVAPEADCTLDHRKK